MLELGVAGGFETLQDLFWKRAEFLREQSMQHESFALGPPFRAAAPLCVTGPCGVVPLPELSFTGKLASLGIVRETLQGVLGFFEDGVGHGEGLQVGRRLGFEKSSPFEQEWLACTEGSLR